MALISQSKTLLSLTLLACLTACSSDKGDTNAMFGSVEDTLSGNGPELLSDDGSATPPSPVPDALATTPIFMTTTCDAASAPADIATSSTLTAPATFLPDTIVLGKLDPESTTNIEHYWTVNLEAGIYHLIMENRIPSGAVTNLGLTVESVDATGEPIERLIRGNVLDYRIRYHNTLMIESAQTLRLKVTPNFGQENYLMGIFQNGTPVPTPYFDDCPTIATLALDTTEAFSLDVAAAITNEVWFQTTLEVADYSLSASAVVTSGENTNIIYTVRSYDQFAQVDRQDIVIRANELDTMFDTTGSIQPAEAGPILLRYRSAITPLNITTTLTQN